MAHHRTSARLALAGDAPKHANKDVEAALDGFIRGEGLSFDRLALHVGIDGETLRLMLDPADRRVLGASRLLPLLRALGTAEPLNAALRLDGHQIGGEVHQLMPAPSRASSGDLMVDAASAAREIGSVVEAVALSMADGRMDPVEAAAVLLLMRPHVERALGLCAQLEVIARRGAP